MADDVLALVPDETAESYDRDGAVLLRGAFKDWVRTLSAGVDRNVAEPGPYMTVNTPEGNPGRFFDDYCNWSRIPEYRDFVERSPAAAIVGRLTKSESVRIFHEHVLIKEPGTLERTPWHHDLPYYCVDGWQLCSLWVPLDPVPRETCPEFVAGSHRWGKVFLPRKFVQVDYERPGEGLEPIPDIEGHRADYDILSWDLAPGDAIAFHFLTVHGAPPNLSADHRRRGFSTRWLGDDATFAERPGEVSPPFPELVGRLKHGDSLDVEEFPVMWQRR